MTRPRLLLLAVAVAALAGGWLWLVRPQRAREAPPPGAGADALPTRLLDVTRGPLSVWSTYTGHVEARDVVNIASRVGGSAVIVELAPGGELARKGALLVRFDTTDLERELVRLNQDHAMAASELESFERAELPIERGELEREVSEQARKDALEEKFLRDSEKLVAEGVMSAGEVEQERGEHDKEQRLETQQRLPP